MALRDNALISNIQLSLLGIILVVGVFYIWRSLSRLEDKLDSISERFLASPVISRSPMGGAGGGFFGLGAGDDMVTDEDADMADSFMKNVFGNMAYSAAAAGARSGIPPAVIVEEEAQDEVPPPASPVPAPAPAPAPAPVAAPAPAADTPMPVLGDDAETEAENPFSKSKIRRMNADALREVCREHGLPVDGTRAVLTDRIIDKLYG